MSANNKTYHPLCYFTIKSATDILPNRFIGFDGAYSGDEEKALGVSDSEWASNEFASIIISGIAVVESSEELVAGDKITSDTDGKAKKAISTEPINGYSLDTITAAGFVRILLCS